VWVGMGRSTDTLREFFDQLGKERAEKLKLVSIDMLASYIEAVRERATNAEIVFDRFHVQRLAHDALDAVRREQVRELRGTDEGKALKKTRWALQKNPWNLTPAEHGKISTVQTTNRPVYRGYLLKETLCGALDRRQANVARRMIGDWIAWALRSRLEPFKKLARTVRKHLDGIIAYVRTRLSNGLAEGMNGKIRTITKRSYGFRDPSSLIAMIYLCCTGLLLAPVRHFPNVGQ